MRTLSRAYCGHLSAAPTAKHRRRKRTHTLSLSPKNKKTGVCSSLDSKLRKERKKRKKFDGCVRKLVQITQFIYTDLLNFAKIGSHMNFKSMGDAPPPYGGGGSGGGGRPPGNFSLARQPSVYSLTFDELQNTMGGLRKDFGSMNMDEFLKNIWTAEESQAIASSFGGAEGGGGAQVGNLQRQGSLTLPRTLSQKTVDEVWRDLFKENGGGKDGSGNGVLNLQQRQPTLGEITLEEFLVRAGVVREDTQSAAKPDNSVFYGELFRSNNNTGSALEFGQPTQNNRVVANRVGESHNHPIPIQSPNVAINMNGIRSSQQQPQQQQQHLFPKQPNIAYASQLPLGNNAQVASPGTRGPMVGIGDPTPTVNKCLVPGGGLECGGMGMVCFGPGTTTAVTASPANPLSSDGLGKSNGDTASLSPVPYIFNGGLRGKRCSGAVEKVVERRQRRMIKNRESAARSRARKQLRKFFTPQLVP